MNDVRYVIVAGVLWLRYTNEPAVWLATWTGAPRARKWQVDVLPHMDASGARGDVDGAAWDLRFSGAGRPYAFPHPLARSLAKTQFVIEEPALSVSGWFEVDGERHQLEGAVGHRAHVWSSQYADSFVWAHANVDATQYAVSAEPEDFVGVTYHDPDGTPLYCYHTERARLTGPDVTAVDVAYEFASRRPLEGWTISI